MEQMTDRFEIQVTVVDLAIRKTIFDRKGYASHLDVVSDAIATIAQVFDSTPQSDQSRQEIQYNETRGVPPQSLRDRVRSPLRVSSDDAPTIDERNRRG